MKKKIKLSLLSVLFLGSALTITLPIVSCSGSSTTTLTISKGNDAQLTAIGSAIANIGKNGTSNNTTALTSNEHANALKATYTNGVATAINNYFTFKNGSTDVADADAIESISLTSTYPRTPRADIMVKVDLKLKNKYDASVNDLTFNVKIGITTDITLSITKGNSNQLTAIGSAIANIGNPNVKNNTSVITNEQHTIALKATYISDVKTAIDNYFTFRNGSNSTSVAGADAIKSISISGSYPSVPGDDINVKVDIKLNDGYNATASDLTLNVKIGVAPITLSVTTGTAIQLATIAGQIARVGNPDANNHNSPITSTQYAQALRATYTGAVKTAIDNYFAFTNGSTNIADSNAIDSIIVSGTYPSAPGPAIVAVFLVLKPPYIASSNTVISIQIGTYAAPTSF